MKFPIKDFFSKYDQIRNFLRIRSHLRKKSLMENFFCRSVYTEKIYTVIVVGPLTKCALLSKKKNALMCIFKNKLLATRGLSSVNHHRVKILPSSFLLNNVMLCGIYLPFVIYNFVMISFTGS